MIIVQHFLSVATILNISEIMPIVQYRAVCVYTDSYLIEYPCSIVYIALLIPCVSSTADSQIKEFIIFIVRKKMLLSHIK